MRVTIDGDRIASVETGAKPASGDERLTGRALLPAMSNVHSHAFQRAMAGMTERRGPGPDSFWTWRRLMYRFLDVLSPSDVEAIAALVYVEMLEAGYASVGEFHYLHHQPGGVPYADPAELAHRVVAAATETGIGMTLLPVLYIHGGANGAPLAGGQLRFGNELEDFLALRDRARSGLQPDGVLGVAPHSLRATTPDELAALVAALPGIPFHIHAAEQEEEVTQVVAWLGARPVEFLLDRFGLDGRWCLIHATQMTPDEVGGLARSGAVAGLCPITEANLGDGIFAGQAFLGAGGALGIGSDSNVRISLAEELRSLEYSQRLTRRARNVLAAPGDSVGTTLYAAALAGGAKALGRELRRAAPRRARGSGGDRSRPPGAGAARAQPAPRRLDLRGGRPGGARRLVGGPPRGPRGQPCRARRDRAALSPRARRHRRPNLTGGRPGRCEKAFNIAIGRIIYPPVPSRENRPWRPGAAEFSATGSVCSMKGASSWRFH